MFMFCLKDFLHDYALILPFCTYSYNDLLVIAEDLHNSIQSNISAAKWELISQKLKLTAEVSQIYWDSLSSLIKPNVNNADILLLLLFNQTYYNWNSGYSAINLQSDKYPSRIRIGRAKLSSFWRENCGQWVNLLAILQVGRSEIKTEMKLEPQTFNALDFFFYSLENQDKDKNHIENFQLKVLSVLPLINGIESISNWIKRHLIDSTCYYNLNISKNGLSRSLEKIGLAEPSESNFLT